MASHQRVGFIIPDSPDQMLPAGENAPLVEGDSRQLNSRRQFQIRKTSSNSHSKRRGAAGNKGEKKGPMKSPSDFTNVGAKSVVSMFTTHSGKTNQSAPVYGGGSDNGGCGQENGENSSMDATDPCGVSASSISKHKDSLISQGANTTQPNSKKSLAKHKIRPVSSISPAGGKPLSLLKGTIVEGASQQINL